MIQNNQFLVPQDITIGGDIGIEQFSETEMKIIKQLLNAPRTHNTKLAKLAQVNTKTAATLIKKLQQRNVVKGFKFILNTNKMEFLKIRIFLKLHDVNIARENQLINYAATTSEIVTMNKTVGDWDMEIDIESLDKGKIRYITRQIRELFSDLIERFNIIEFYKYYKRSYLPSYVFKEVEDFKDKLIIIDLKN